MFILFTWRITQKQFEPLFYVGAALLLFGVFYNPISDWRAGKKKEVITSLRIAGIIIAIVFIILAVKRL
jgi:drug/metabolite transporter (DMT)-like permease